MCYYDIAYSLSSDGEGLWELLDCCCLFIPITLHLFSQHLLNAFSTSFPPICLFSLSPFSFFCLSPIFLDELDCTVVLCWYGIVLYCCYNKHGSAKQSFLTTNAHYSSWMDTFADIRLWHFMPAGKWVAAAEGTIYNREYYQRYTQGNKYNLPPLQKCILYYCYCSPGLSLEKQQKCVLIMQAVYAVNTHSH